MPWRAWAAALLGTAVMAWLQVAGAASSVEPQQPIEERVNRLASELRCLVCQNQTIADSQAELAMQLKGEIRNQLSHGASEDQVVDFMVQRYGDFVRYRPPLNRETWLLWGGPIVLLLLGAGLAAVHWRERRNAPLDEAESAWPAQEDGST